MRTYALKAPAQGWKPPPWLTVHNVVTAVVVAAALLVIILLARAVGRLAKAVRAAAPAPAPKSSGGRNLLLLALAAGAAIVGYAKLGHPATAVGATPAPTPAPTPHPVPTVTQTVAPHVTGPHFTPLIHLTGGDIVAMWIIGGVVAIVLLGAVLRRSS